MNYDFYDKIDRCRETICNWLDNGKDLNDIELHDRLLDILGWFDRYAEEMATELLMEFE